jgi:uncharacterized protein involved in type VI secretion and phage assembly
MSTAAPALLSYAVVRVDGEELAPELAALLTLLRVRDSVRLPDQAHLRLADPDFAYVDDELLAVGKTLEVLYAAPGAGAATSVFVGAIESIELDLHPGGAFVAATAYEPAFALHRNRCTQIFQHMTSSGIAEKTIAAAGLRAAIEDTRASAIEHPFMLQNEETDWRLLWRLADAIGYEVVGEGQDVHFRPAGSARPDGPIDLRAPDELICFRPRITGAQQLSGVQVRGWDPAGAEAIVASEEPPAADSNPGLRRTDVAAAAHAGEWMVGDRTVLGPEEAGALASALAARQANAWVQAEGVARGDPRLRAGCEVLIGGVGSRFGGTYHLTSTTHVLRGGRGYETHFSISGRSPETLGELLGSGRATAPQSAGVVVGVVTQTDDPEGLGRVRVRYPALGEDAEGWWARIAAPAAGTSRGLLMMPVAGDEVVLAFEQGDSRRPYVLGSVWNGKATPGELVRREGSFSLASDHDIDMSAAEQVTIAAQQALNLRSEQNLLVKAGKQLGLAGTSVTVEADGRVTIKADADLTLEAANIGVQASGTLRISAGQVLFQ